MSSIATSGTFKNYLFFWGGQLFSLLGSSIVHFVLIWWINVITPDRNLAAFLLGLTNFLGMLPLIVLSPIAGVFIDKWNRKYIIAIADSMQAFITFFLVLIFFFRIEDVMLVILINSLRGICQAFHFPTVKAIIPLMIPKDKLSRMNAIDYGVNGLVHIAGPAVGALLYGFLPIASVLWVDIITFFIAIIPLILIKIPEVKQNNVKKESFSFIKDFRQGIRGLKKVPGLVILLVLISVVNFLGVPFGTLLPVFISDIHYGDQSGVAYAFVIGLMQIGMVLGAVIATIKKDYKNRVLVITGCILISAVGYFMSALSPIGNFTIIGIGGMMRAAMTPLINTNFLTIIQLHVPPEKQGKVMSIVVSLAWFVIPPGSLVAGTFAALMGIVPLFLTFASLIILTVVIIVFFTNVRSVRYEHVYEVEEEKTVEDSGDI
ncbi:MAG: MFS transporter [Candidatus Hodarchaeota archaeon]